jgi:hypothetical protein
VPQPGVEAEAFPFREDQVTNPKALFDLFIPPKLYKEIADHTNNYAHRERHKQEQTNKNESTKQIMP